MNAVRSPARWKPSNNPSEAVVLPRFWPVAARYSWRITAQCEPSAAEDAARLDEAAAVDRCPDHIEDEGQCRRDDEEQDHRMSRTAPERDPAPGEHRDRGRDSEAGGAALGRDESKREPVEAPRE